MLLFALRQPRASHRTFDPAAISVWFTNAIKEATTTRIGAFSFERDLLVQCRSRTSIMIDLKTAFDAGIARIMANLKAVLDASAVRIVTSVKAKLDASTGRLVNDLRATLAAIDARNKALLQSIGSTLNARAAQVLSVQAGIHAPHADTRKTLAQRIRLFFSYIVRILMTGRLRPPVVAHREQGHHT